MVEFEENIEEKKVTQYLIPANVNARFEFIEGIGWKEFIFVVIALAIGVGIYFLLGLFTATEQFKLSELPLAESVGIIEDKFTKIDGDIVTKTREVIPAPIRLILLLIPVAGTFLAVRVDPSTGLSLVSNLRDAKAFRSKQKRYIYKYNSGSEV